MEPGKNIIKLKFRNSDSYYKPYEFQVQAVNSVNKGPLSPKHTAYSGERCKYITACVWWLSLFVAEVIFKIRRYSAIEYIE